MNRFVAFTDTQPVSLVGGKAFMLSRLQAAEVPIPDGSVIPTTTLVECFEAWGMDASTVHAALHLEPQALDTIRHALKVARWPPSVLSDLQMCYAQYDAPLCVRSSSVSEDGTHSSFAGIYRTTVNVRTFGEFLLAVRDCWQSAFDDQAVLYVRALGSPLYPMAVVVQPLIPSFAAGVAFVEQGRLRVSAAYGLGLGVVSGRVPCDTYEWADQDGEPEVRVAHKERLQVANPGRTPVTVGQYLRVAGRQRRALLSKVQGYDERHAIVTVEPHPQYRLADQPVLDEGQRSVLRDTLYHVVERLGGGHWDLEWGITPDERVFITQARPLTASLQPSAGSVSVDAQSIIHAQPLCSGVATGPARIIRSEADVKAIRSGDILVMDWVPDSYVGALMKGNGLIIRDDSVLSHCAIVAREIHIPCVGGVTAEMIIEGSTYAIDGATGSIRQVSDDLVSTAEGTRAVPTDYRVHGWLFAAADEIYVTSTKMKRWYDAWHDILVSLPPGGSLDFGDLSGLVRDEWDSNFRRIYQALVKSAYESAVADRPDVVVHLEPTVQRWLYRDPNDIEGMDTDVRLDY